MTMAPKKEKKIDPYKMPAGGKLFCLLCGAELVASTVPVSPKVAANTGPVSSVASSRTSAGNWNTPG